MGVYLLNCEEQKAKYIWSSWLESTANSTVRVMPKQPRSQPQKTGQVIFLISLIISFIFFERISLSFSQFPQFDASSFFKIFLGSTTALSPLLLLYYSGYILRKSEISFQNYMGIPGRHYVDVFPLAPPR